MSSVDNRVVKMEFDNKQFEKETAVSMKTMEKLEKSLKLENAGKGLQDLDKAAKSVDLSTIAAGIETLTNKFSTMGIIAMTAIMNLTNSVINLGTQMVKSLTIDQVTEGFTKYEQKVTAVQTIMNATGKTIDEVNGSLEKLNWFTDETSYNFMDMVSNIGKFTAAGVDLEVAITAMEGIANLAAVSGQGINEAGRAMYNFAQAIGVGSVKLMDWRSIENANMATIEFKQTILDSAVSLGTLTQAADGTYKTLKGTAVSVTDFNQALAEGWFSSEVLIDSLGKYGEYADEIYKITTEQGLSAAEAMEMLGDGTMALGAKAFRAAQEAKTFTDAINATKDAVSTGWMTSFELIFGDFVEAKELWTDFTGVLWDVFAAGGEVRNDMLRTWRDMGGREKLISAISRAYENLSEIVGAVKEGFREIFPPATADTLMNITNGISLLADKFKMGEESLENLKSTFKGLFAILSIAWQLISALARGFGKLVSSLVPAGKGFLNFTGSIGEWLVRVDEAIKKGNFFNKAIDAIATGLGFVISKFKEFGKAIADSKFGEFIKKIKDMIPPLSSFADFIGMVFGGIVTGLKAVGNFIKPVVDVIKAALTGLKNRFQEAFGEGNFSPLYDLINGGIISAILVGIVKFIASLSGATKEAGGIFGALKAVFSSACGFIGNLNNILNRVAKSLDAFTGQVKSKTLMNIAIAIGILAAALLVLSGIPSEKLTTALTAISVLFIELFASMAIFEKAMAGSGFRSIMKVTSSMIALAAAVLILSFAMRNLARLDWEGIAKGLTAIAGLMAMLVAASMVLQKSSGKLIKGATGLILFATAISILAKAVERLSSISIEGLGKGLIAIGVLMGELIVFTKLADKMSVGSGVGLIALAVAVNLLAMAVGKFGAMDTNSIIQGLAAMGVLLVELGIFTKLAGGSEKMVSIGISMIAIAAAMHILAGAVQKFGSMNIETLAKGLIAMAVALGIIIGAIWLVPTDIVSTAISFVILATAMVILGKALTIMGGMSWEAIAKGLITLAASLTIIAIAMHFMTTALPGAFALLVISASLVVLAAALFLIGAIPLMNIVQGLAAIAAVFVIFAVAGYALGPVVLVILALGAAMLIFGVGLLAAGASLIAFSVGLGMLAANGMSGVQALLEISIALLPLVLLAPALVVLSVAIIALGVAVALLGAGFIVLSAGLLMLGVSGAVGIKALDNIVLLLDTLAPYALDMLKVGGAMIILGAGAVVAGAGLLILGAGLLSFGAGMKLVEAAGPEGMIILAEALERLADVVSLKVAAAVLVLAGLAASVAIFGTFAGVGALGLMLLAQSLGMLAMITPLFSVAGKQLAATMETIGKSVTSDVQSSVKVIKELGDNLKKFAKYGADSAEAALAMGPGFASLAEGLTVLMTVGTGGDAPTLIGKLGDNLKKFGKWGIDAGLGAQEMGPGFTELAAGLQNLIAVGDFSSIGPLIGTLGDNLKKFGKWGVDAGAGALAMGPGFTELSKGLIDMMGIDGDLAFVAEIMDELQNSLKKWGKWGVEAGAGAQAMGPGFSELATGLTALLAVDGDMASVPPIITALSESLKKYDKWGSEAGAGMTAIGNGLTPMARGISNLLAIEGDPASIPPIITAFSESLKKYDKWGSDAGTAMSAIGEGLSSMSTGFKALGGIDQSHIDLINTIAEYSKTLKEAADGITKGGKAYSELGTGLTNLSNGLTSVSTNTIDGLATAGDAVVAFANEFPSVSGTITAAIPEITTALTELVNSIINYLTDNQATVKNTASTKIMTDGIIKGIKDKQNDAKNATKAVGEAIIGELKRFADQAKTAGESVGAGFVQGIKNKISDATNAGTALGRAALDAAKKALDSNSPSKEFIKLGGDGVGEGFIIGIHPYIALAAAEAEKMADATIDAFSSVVSKVADALDGDMDYSPVIKPVLDLDDITKNVQTMNGMFTNPKLNVEGGINRAAKISTGVTDAKLPTQTSTDGGGQIIEQTNFTQNNYSPKELSRVTIYRNTKAQLQLAKGVTKK